MTWARTLATGSGRLDFRLEIAGCQYEWTTSSRITHADGAENRKVVPGLQYQGLELNERAVLKDCWVDVSGITVKIKPTRTPEDTIDAFTRTPEPIAYLAENGAVPGLEFDSTDIVLDSAATLVEDAYYHLGSECIRAGAGNTITRAQWGTTAQRHYTKYGATSAITVPIYLYPPTLEGRRATLHVYGAGDDGAADGTVVWRGIVSRPPRLASDGLSWDIALDPITKSFEQRVAASESLQYRIRGIYHSGNFPMRITYTCTNYAKATADPTTGSFGIAVDVLGFYETREDFVAEVNAQLVDILASRAVEKGSAAEFSSAVYSESTSGTYIPGPSSCPTIYCLTEPNLASTDGPYRNINIAFHTRSYLEGFCDGDVGSLLYSGEGYNNYRAPRVIGQQIDFASYAIDYQQPVTYRFGGAEGAFISPLGESPNAPFFTYPLSSARAALGSVGEPSTLSTLYPANRLYLDIVDGIAVGDLLLVKNGDKVITLQVDSVDTVDRWITADVPEGETVIWFDEYTEIVPARLFALNTDLHGFLEQLQDKAPNANDGDTPYVPEGDVSLDAFAVPYTVSSIADYWKYRNYVWLKPTSIREIVREELKAIGWMLRLTATGQIGCTRLPLATASSSATSLDETRGDILLPAKGQVGAWPRWEAQADGLVNTIQVSLGYRLGDDDFDPKFDFTVRNITSIAEHKSSGTKGDQAIAPKSTSAFAATLPGVDPSPEVTALLNNILNPTNVSQWVSGYLRVLSQDYATVTVSVPFRFFGLLIGDYVNVTCSFLPNGLGTRGITNGKAVVVGRKWSFDPASNSMGSLTLYFPREVASGYAPSANITGQANVSGNTWDLGCSASDELNVLMSEDGDGDVAKHFAVNDKVQIVKRRESIFPTTVLGTVVSSTTGTIRVTFTSTWTPGSDDWVLQYQIDADNATTHMKQFSFVADAIRQLTSGAYARRYL